MKHNTMKRALALTLSVLTVAAPMTANVGGVLQEVAIVASAANEATADDNYLSAGYGCVQAGGYLSVSADSVAFIDGLYEITVDGGKYQYNKIAGSDAFAIGTVTLASGKAYVLRTKAYMNLGGKLTLNSKDLNGDDLAAGIYEYEIKKIDQNSMFNAVTLKAIIKPDDTANDSFQEPLTVKQNDYTINYIDAKTADQYPDLNTAVGGETGSVKGYVVAQGAPVEITATPDSNHTNMMMALRTNDGDGTGAVKSQTKSGSALTLTVVPNQQDTGKAVYVKWAEYKPTLELTNNNGTITATDVGFNKLITNEVVGTYAFKYGKTVNNAFVTANVNAKGQYIADGSQATPLFTPKDVTVGNTTYNFVAAATTAAQLTGTIPYSDQNNTAVTVEKKNPNGTWTTKITPSGQSERDLTLADTADAGTYRVTSYVIAAATNSAVLSENPFKITTEFTVVNANVTGLDNLLFKAPGVGTATYVETKPENGVYKVAWQNGAEITPQLTLYHTKADKTNDTANKYEQGRDYYVTGATTASEAGVYEITITPIDKRFNDGEEIVITWEIVNTNNYVALKKTPTCTTKAAVTNSATDDEKAEAIKNGQSFNIGYRQASKETIVENIIKSLDFVGSEDLTVVEYKKVTWSADADGAVVKATLGDEEGATVEDPSEKSGTYVAYVANALKNDGKTGAMVKDGNTYTSTQDGNVDDATGLYKVYFQVTPTIVLISPAVTEMTYGDNIKLNELYKVIDKDTKDEIGVPWKSGGAPKITLWKGETKAFEDQDSTVNLAAGEYTYTVAATALDDTNYKVRQIIAEDDVKFTVKARDLKDMDFGTVNVPVTGAKNVTITKAKLATEANKIEANPADFAIYPVDAANTRIYPTELGGYEYANHKVAEIAGYNTSDFSITGGTTSAKATELGKMFTVTLKGIGNFTGTKTVSWIVGDSALSDKVMSYEAEFDAAKPRVMAKLDLNEVLDDVTECGFYYCNNGKMNDIVLDSDVWVNKNTGVVMAEDATAYARLTEENKKLAVTAQEYAQSVLKQADATGENANQKNCKKVGFSEKAVASAKSGKGILTAEIANSSVKKQVYIMPYVKYSNGNIAYGEVESFNYYDMVLAAEGALKVTKTDVVGDGTNNTTVGKNYVKVDVTRVNKKGYEVERYGLVYNNSDAWDTATAGQSKTSDAERGTAYNWLNLDYESEKTVKVAEVDAKDLATKIGTNTYIVNTTLKSADKKTDYGYGAKTVWAKAFIKIKDAAGNEKVYYSHLADVTYGGFTVDATTGAINDPDADKAVFDSKNKNQITFWAPTNAEDDYDLDKDGVKIQPVTVDEHNAITGANMTRMAASTGNKTFLVDWTDQKNS